MSLDGYGVVEVSDEEQTEITGGGWFTWDRFIDGLINIAIGFLVVSAIKQIR